MERTNKPIDMGGIHHVTAISGDAQRSLDFYAGVLGLRLVKRTVNFDDPHTYHLYFGDRAGSPGTVLTFFPWGDESAAGRDGSDQIAGFSFSIPAGAIPFWRARLTHAGVENSLRESAFDGSVVSFLDPDGFRVDLVGTATDERIAREWGGIPADASIRGFHAVTLSERDPEATGAHLVEDLGFTVEGKNGPRTRFAAGPGTPGGWVDVVGEPDRLPGSMGRGVVHHVAFRTPDDASQAEVREHLLRRGLRVTPVRDRLYFRSIYFHEPGGVLFEVATDTPGFAVDEPAATLGSALKLPPWMEGNRRIIEQALPVIV
jgi:glyoxalase family protein